MIKKEKTEQEKRILRSTYLTLAGLIIIVGMFTANNIVSAAKISMTTNASAHPFILALTSILVIGLIIEFIATTIYYKKRKANPED